MKLALGTVQFGMDYGIANNGGQTNPKMARKILEFANQHHIDTLDTAAAYGNSEQILGLNDLDQFRVISKIPPSTNLHINPSDWVEKCLKASLKNLKVSSLSGLLLHRPLELLQANGKCLYNALVDAKKQGVTEKIGISIYSPSDLDSLKGFDFDIVQAPMNLLDRRLINSGWLNRLKQGGTEIHIRSAFLQGLLLMPPAERPPYFAPWSDLLTEYDCWLQQQRLMPLQACLGYLNSIPEIDKIVVGVDTTEQLKEIVKSVDFNQGLSAPDSLQSDDQNLINPAQWSL